MIYLLICLPLLRDLVTFSSKQYHKTILKLPNSKFKFTFVSEDTVLTRLKDMDGNNAAGLDNLSEKF